jgi:GDP-D-mannose dehydratase
MIFEIIISINSKYKSSEIYDLAGANSNWIILWKQPVENDKKAVLGTLNLLETAIRFSGQPIKFYNAGSW